MSQILGAIFHWQSGPDIAGGSGARRPSDRAISPAAAARLSKGRRSPQPRWRAHWSWFETAVRAPQSNHPNREDEIAGILFRRQHLSLHRSGSASRRLADGQNRPCPSAGKRGVDRQPALRAVPTLIPLRWTGRTSPPGRPEYPSSEIRGGKDRAQAPGSVRVSSGAARTGHAAQIAKGKSFRKRRSLSITARVILEQGIRTHFFAKEGVTHAIL